MGGHRYRELALMLRLVRLLLREPWDAPTLAARLDVSRETVLRLLRILRQTGLVISRQRVVGGYVQHHVTRAAVRRWVEGGAPSRSI